MELNGKDTQLNMKDYLPRFEEYLEEQDVGFMMSFAETMLLLHRVVVVSDGYFQSMGTSKGRFLILIRLLLSDTPEGESISALRPFYPISYAAMSGVLDTLEKDGMIERCANPADRRRVNIRLTRTGRDFIVNFMPNHLENIKRIASGFIEDEVAVLSTSLKKLITGFEQVSTARREKVKTEPAERGL